MVGRRLAVLAVLLAAMTPIRPSCAEDYPSRAVKIIVPFGAGGPADIAARLLGNIMQEKFGQPFVVENRTGGNGMIGAEAPSGRFISNIGGSPNCTSQEGRRTGMVMETARARATCGV
jgi:tripartite-type tricarboxylate transporter receptor subunit TctC